MKKIYTIIISLNITTLAASQDISYSGISEKEIRSSSYVLSLEKQLYARTH